MILGQLDVISSIKRRRANPMPLAELLEVILGQKEVIGSI
jgi:hypothetical protein